MPQKRIRTYRKEDLILGPILLCFLAGLIHPLFWLAAIILFTFYGALFERDLAASFEKPKVWVWAVPTVLFGLAFAFSQPFVADDLMRDVVAHKFDYDYSRLYGDSPLLPTINLWPAFDWLLGYLERAIGPVATVQTIVITFFGLLMGSLALAMIKLTRGHPDQWLVMAVLMMLAFLSPLGSRADCGRPEILFTAFLFAAVYLPPLLWVLLGLLLTPFYWLAPLYAVGALLLDCTLAKRVMAGLVVGAGGMLFWYLHSEGAWLDALLLIPQWNANRLMPVGELMSISAALTKVPMLILAGMLLVALSREGLRRKPLVIPLTLVLAIFLLPNLVRYIATVAGLMLLLLAAYLPKTKLPIPNRFRALLFGALSLTALKSGLVHNQDDPSPQFQIPEGSYVLAEFNRGEYASIMFNPHVRFTPAYELGATDREIQQILKEMLVEHRLSCEALYRYAFTHVQEHSLIGIPPCLELEQVYQEWRLWRIKPQTANAGENPQ